MCLKGLYPQARAALRSFRRLTTFIFVLLVFHILLSATPAGWDVSQSHSACCPGEARAESSSGEHVGLRATSRPPAQRASPPIPLVSFPRCSLPRAPWFPSFPCHHIQPLSPLLWKAPVQAEDVLMLFLLSASQSYSHESFSAVKVDKGSSARRSPRSQCPSSSRLQAVSVGDAQSCASGQSPS